jgi:hypothetical protein
MEIPMKLLSKLVLVLPLLVGYHLASANPPMPLFGEVISSSSFDRTVMIDNSTQSVNVTGGEVIKFVAHDKSFTYNFDGISGNVQLGQIAPNGFVIKDVIVYVAPNPMYQG